MNSPRRLTKGRKTAATSPPQRSTVVLDTGVLYSVAAPYTIEEFKALQPVDYVVPAKALWELDQLKQHIDTRDRARAALNLLKQFVERGAARKSVSCGDGCTLRMASLAEEVAQPGLNMELADDCILAVCLHLASQGQTAKLATTEFPLYAKAVATGVDAIYLERYAETKTLITRREQASFRMAWSRLQAADSPWSVCRRALSFLQNPLVRRLIQPIREKQEPQSLALIIGQFDALYNAWTEQTDLETVIQATLGIAPPWAVSYSVQILTEPLTAADQIMHRGIGVFPASRPETAEERSLRIKAEEERRRAQEQFIVDEVLSRLELIREFVLDQVGEDLL